MGYIIDYQTNKSILQKYNSLVEVNCSKISTYYILNKDNIILVVNINNIPIQ